MKAIVNTSNNNDISIGGMGRTSKQTKNVPLEDE